MLQPALTLTSAVVLHVVALLAMSTHLGSSNPGSPRTTRVARPTPVTPWQIDGAGTFPGTPDYVDRPRIARVWGDCGTNAMQLWDRWADATSHLHRAPYVLAGHPTIGIGGGQLRPVSLGIVRALTEGDWVAQVAEREAVWLGPTGTRTAARGPIAAWNERPDREKYGGLTVDLIVEFDATGRVVDVQAIDVSGPVELVLASRTLARRLRVNPVASDRTRRARITIHLAWPDSDR